MMGLLNRISIGSTHCPCLFGGSKKYGGGTLLASRGGDDPEFAPLARARRPLARETPPSGRPRTLCRETEQQADITARARAVSREAAVSGAMCFWCGTSNLCPLSAGAGRRAESRYRPATRRLQTAGCWSNLLRPTKTRLE